MEILEFLIDPFYHQPIYKGDGCVEYNCIELKCDGNVRKIFFIYSEFSTKCSIELAFSRWNSCLAAQIKKAKNDWWDHCSYAWWICAVIA